MEIPTYDEMMNPLLKAIHLLGGSGSIDEINEKTIELLNLPDEIVDIPYGDRSRSEVEYRLARTRTYLKKYGLLENPSREVWAIKKPGDEPLNVDPSDVVRRVKEMKSFTVELWSKIFNILRCISPFQIIRILIPVTKERYCFVDGWVLGNLVLSIIILLMCSAPNLRWWEAIAIGYGGIRVFEVFIYQINVLLFDEYRAKKAGKTYYLRGFRRIVILLLNNYVEIIFWFALFYRNFGWAFETGAVSLDSFLVSLNFSFVTMTTFGHTDIFPKEILGDILIFFQSIIGIFMALLILARFVSLIPNPETLDEFEKDNH